MVLKWGCDDETTPWGFTGQNATNISYFWTEVGIKQVYICPDLNYRRGRPRRQVDPGPPQHRRRPAAGHHLRVAQGRHLGQGVRRDPRRRHGQGRGLRARRRRRRPEDARVGLAEVRRARVDHQGARPRVRQASAPRSCHYFGGSHDPRPVLARARPPRVHPARHAGPRRPRRAPVADRVLRHAARRGSRRTSATSTPSLSDAPARARPEQRRRLGRPRTSPRR